MSDFSGTFRWTDQRDCLLLREIRLVEPYLYKMGSKMAGQKWTEVAENINNYDLFKQMSRDQRSVREHFSKLLASFKSKMKKEEASSGITPPSLTESEQLLEEISEIIVSKSKEICSEESDKARANIKKILLINKFIEIIFVNIHVPHLLLFL